MNPLTSATYAAGGRPRIAVVIPCFRVSRWINEVIARIGGECSAIYVIDDACPERSGDLVEARCQDARVNVIRHPVNRGVGAAVMTGYRRAIAERADIIVKIDGDGQMEPALIPSFVAPIIAGHADYTKGNRFYDVANVGRMPAVRAIGNAALSFMTKLSCGYWDIFDPTNGYTAIHAKVAGRLPFEKISARYFFESDMLFRLSTIRAVVVDIPMDARYGDETSGVVVSRVLGEFFVKHVRNAFKRIFYNYFLRDFTVASLELIVGASLLIFGATFGIAHWIASAREGVPTPPGTVMVAALPVLAGLQLLLGFIAFDVAAVPRQAIHPLLAERDAISTSRLCSPEGTVSLPTTKEEHDGVGRRESEEG